MNVDKLADFGNINTAHGDVEAGFLFFFLAKVRYHCIIRVSYNVSLTQVFF